MVLTFLVLSLMLEKSFPKASFKPIFTYQNPTGEEGLTWPQAFASDDLGGSYILDMAAKAIYHWDSSGKFLNKIGGPGLGPGEMNFGDKWGMIAVNQQFIMAFDEKKIHCWTRQGVYVRTTELSAKGYGRWKSFIALPDGFLVMDLNWDKKVSRLLILDENFNVRKEVATVEGGVYQKNKQGGWDYNPYAPSFIIGSHHDQIWYGDRNDNRIHRLEKPGRILLPLSPKEVTPEEARNQREQFARRKHDEDRLILPEHFPLFSAIMPLADHLICIVAYDPDPSQFRGIVLDDRTGAVKAQFDEKLGEENGAFLGVNGKILFLRPSPDGVVVLSLNELVIAK